jgi:hypothetical protein
LEFEPETNMIEAHMIDLHTSRFLCLIDYASTHIILCHKEFFHHIEDQAPFNIKTIVGYYYEFEVLPPNQLYYFNLKAPKIHMTSFARYSNISLKVNNDIMDLWHTQLGHLGNIMIRRMINNIQDLPLKLEHLNQVKSRFCAP